MYLPKRLKKHMKRDFGGDWNAVVDAFCMIVSMADEGEAVRAANRAKKREINAEFQKALKAAQNGDMAARERVLALKEESMKYPTEIITKEKKGNGGERCIRIAREAFEAVVRANFPNIKPTDMIRLFARIGLVWIGSPSHLYRIYEGKEYVVAYRDAYEVCREFQKIREAGGYGGTIFEQRI